MKIEVGMYVRTKKGEIAKVISNDSYWINIDKFKKDGMTLRTIRKIDISKTSHNIIDLIEVGDYVNGLRVHGITDYGLEVYMFGDCKEILEENEINSIVTKEQFSSMEYRLGDE